MIDPGCVPRVARAHHHDSITLNAELQGIAAKVQTTYVV